MSKYKFFITTFILLIVLATTILIINVEANDNLGEMETYHFSNQMLINSSLYTGVDDLEVNTIKGELNEYDELVKTSDNGLYSLYFNPTLCIFKIKNEITNYIYQSALEEIDESTSSNYYAGFLSSSFSIRYYSYLERSSRFDINTQDAWFTMATTKKQAEKDAIDDENQKTKYNINLADNMEYRYDAITDGIKVTIKYANAKTLATDRSFNLGIEITAYVTIDNDGLHVKIPRDEIKEENPKYVLASISVMPMLGATYNNSVKGYMVIPDGAGALMRYGSIKTTSPQQYRYFGDDMGSKTISTIYSADYYSETILSAPVFGLVNGINQDGILGILESGANQAILTVSPSGTYNIKENFMYPSFVTRFNYNLFGINSTMVDELYNEDIAMSYVLLSNEDANYVGMALTYQDYLVDNNLLFRNSENRFNTRLDFLMSDAVSSMFGYRNITMTSLQDVQKMINDYQKAGLDLTINLLGWSKYGFSGATPNVLKYNTSLGSKKQFVKFIEQLEEEGTHVYLYDNYLIGFTRGNFKSTDAAKSLLRLRLTFNDEAKNLFNNYSYIDPRKIEKLSNELINKGEKKLGLKSIALDGIGYNLFSYYDGVNHTRNDCYEILNNVVSNISDKYQLALYKPNSYMWQYINTYFDMPVYANKYHLYSDNVPFIPYVLKGYIDCYGGYLNFNSLGEVGNLRYLDYGIMPSYLLTEEATHNLRYTDTYGYYTTANEDWESEIKHFYDTYKAGYEAILNSTVVSRVVPVNGLVVIIYQSYLDNTYKTLIINYNNQDITYKDILIKAESYEVVGGRYE